MFTMLKKECVSSLGRSFMKPPHLLASTSDDLLPKHSKTTKPHNRKEHHNEKNPNFKISRAASLHTYCLHTHHRDYRRGLSHSRRQHCKDHGRLRARSAKCAWQKHQGCTRRIWSRRFFAGPHASKVSFHLRDRSRRSD